MIGLPTLFVKVFVYIMCLLSPCIFNLILKSGFQPTLILAPTRYVHFYNILTTCSILNINKNVNQSSQYITIPSQHHINDYINILLALNLEHIIKMLEKHIYMERTSL